jgi:uncharacterized membrane protein YbhN (UPF0104 family)
MSSPQEAGAHRTHHALGAARAHLGRRALKLLGYVLVAYLVLKLIPGLAQALTSLEHVSWRWVVGAMALEVLSEVGFVVSWRQVVDPDNTLHRDGRGRRMDARIAWAQLGGGMLVPGGSLSGVGVGAWLLHRLGMPAGLIAERQFNLSFLNTAVDALALVVFGLALAAGVDSHHSVLLTVVPAAVALGGLVAVRVIAARSTPYAARIRARHPRIATTIATLAAAVADTDRLLRHRLGRRAVAGAVAYLVLDTLVLWTAFFAVRADPVPSYPVVVMAYVIGALGNSLPLPAGVGAVGGIAGMLIAYGVGHEAAIASVVLYGAVGLIVPLIGGAIAYAVLRRQLGPVPDGAVDPAVSPIA